MRQPANHLSLKDLVAQASAMGPRVRPDQVVRWHKAGLVPRPVQRRLGRGLGSVTLGYPPEALHHVVAVARLVRRKRDLKWVGWVMWLAGYPVTPAIRVQLQETANWFEAHVWDAMKELEIDDPVRSPRALFQQLSIRPGLRRFGLRPGQFRGKASGAFDTALYLLLRMLSGVALKPEEIDSHQVQALARGAAGMAKAAPTLRVVLKELAKEPGSRAADTPTPEQVRRQRERQATMDQWRNELRAKVSELSESVGASLIRSGLPFMEDVDFERWREECIALWTVLNAKGSPLAIPIGPPLPIFLTWYVFRQETKLGSWMPLFHSQGWHELEPIMVAVFRTMIEAWGIPLPERRDRRATLLPLSLEEHPDAHLICRPIETGTRRRPRRQRVRASSRRRAKPSGH